jgi:hypothetical protein
MTPARASRPSDRLGRGAKRHEQFPAGLSVRSGTVVFFGASGDLALARRRANARYERRFQMRCPGQLPSGKLLSSQAPKDEA